MKGGSLEGRVAVTTIIFCPRARGVLGVDPLSGFFGLAANLTPVEMTHLTS